MGTESFKPIKVLRVYSRSREYYIEIHDVSKVGEEFHESAGRPLRKETLKKLLGSVNKREVKSYWMDKIIDPGILHFIPEKHNRKIVWWRPEQQYDMSFKKETGIKDGKIWMPALLFVLTGGSLEVYSIKNERPTLSSEVYYAPLLNYLSGGHICWGTTKNNTDKIHEIDVEVREWEKMLWNSRFTHAGSSPSTKTDLIGIYKNLVNTKTKFPFDELLPTNCKLKNFI